MVVRANIFINPNSTVKFALYIHLHTFYQRWSVHFTSTSGVLPEFIHLLITVIHLLITATEKNQYREMQNNMELPL